MLPGFVCTQIVAVQRESKGYCPSAECANDYSDSDSDDQQDWDDSACKDIDLTASEDILCEDDDEPGHVNQSQTSVHSSFSEGTQHLTFPL